MRAQAGPLTEYWASQGSWALVVYLLSGGVIAMLYNLVHYRMIQARAADEQPVYVCMRTCFLGTKERLGPLMWKVSSCPHILCQKPEAAFLDVQITSATLTPVIGMIKVCPVKLAMIIHEGALVCACMMQPSALRAHQGQSNRGMEQK